MEIMEEHEIKHEFELNYNLQCRTCLSIGRKLVPLGKCIEVYQKLTSNTEFFDMEISEQLQVCWECHALMLKAARFKQRVERANEALRTGQTYSCGTLSTLTTIVLNDTHVHTVYIDNQINTQTETTKSETNEDLEQGFNNDNLNDDIDETIHLDNLPDEFESIELYTKTELKHDVEDLKIQSKSKVVNRWAIKRRMQNRKPKFRILTNKDSNKIIRMEINNDIETETYSQSNNSSEFQCKNKNDRTKFCKKHHKKNQTTCDSCSTTFKDKRHLSAQRDNHSNKYTCLVCEYHTYCGKEKDDHLEGHKKVFQCLKCELMFGNRREFYKHYKEWHEKFICDYCGISFKMRYCIKDHIRKQHSPFECIPCNKRFARYNGLWLHNKIHHTAPSSAGYCVECDKQYPDVYRYRWHLANSARHKPRKKARIPCPGCDKVFSKNIYMKDHYNLVHLKCYKYRCEDCDKNFIRNADLVKHRRRVHEGILPPKNKICYMCGRGFTTNKILANHIRTHTGERPFACSLCPARFAQRAALAGHARALHHRA